ncbi:MAG: glycogen debranching protein GlgX [Pseudomonadota bacterium]
MTRHGAVSSALEPGSPHRLGAHFDGNGTNFALFSEHGQEVFLCLFSADGTREEQRIALRERTGAVWHGYVPGLRPGALYGYRVAGSYDPHHGHRFNVNKLLIDPYARAFHGAFTNHSATFGYQQNAPDGDLSFDTRDSAAHVPKCVVPDPSLCPPDAKTLARGWDDALIYEAHVKGATMRHPDIPVELRGTYDAMASPAMLDHLTNLGVTAVELLPIQALKSEAALVGRGLVNYWGYNTAGFFAPEPRYFGPSGAAGFRAMVERFHAAGIEVILDVVYNHSAESDHFGPTISFRGLDNKSYYRLIEGQPRYYVNDTGCGNALDVRHPFVLRMVLDSLRFWVECMGVDGFRFDLATTLCRERHGFDRRGGFLDALRQDPVLMGVKLIAEPWDIGPGGYQLGAFPAPFAEWNDQYRDSVRRFWRGDPQSVPDLGRALLGSAEVFDRRGRRPWSTINFVASHDGFTLADTTRYEKRHNHANGENNADGHHSNFSENFGVEGDTDDPTILAKRRLRARNLLATVFLSQGTPMLLAGDEGGQSQAGNNNSYCQDNETSWLDWASFDPELIAFTAAMSAFRRAHPVLRQADFLHGAKRPHDRKKDVEWRAFDGGPLNWRDPGLASLCLHLRGNGEVLRADADADEVFIAINREASPQELHLPDPGHRIWMREIDTTQAAQAPEQITAGTLMLPAKTLSAFVLRDAG